MTENEHRKKSEFVEEEYRLIKILSRAGKEIISNLTFPEIANTLYSNIKDYIPSDIFALAVHNEKNETLDFYGAREKGEPKGVFSHSLKDEFRLSVWCFAKGQEIRIDNFKQDFSKYTASEPPPMQEGHPQSIIFLPLTVKDKKVGTLTVQSYNVNAYNSDHVHFLSNLAVYTAIAIDNAKAYQQLKEQKTELEETEQLLRNANNTKDKFFSIIAHDLKNPFLTILGLSDIMVTEFNALDKNKLYTFNVEIQKAAKYTYHLLENLLHWARSQKGNLQLRREKLNLSALVQENLSLLSSNAKKKAIRLNSEVPADAEIYGDRNTIVTVLRNLLTNALKFTNLAGSITVYAGKSGDFYEITVEDTGIGMSDEVKNKLFRIDVQQSSTGTAKEKGTGLGLILCKEFIEKNNGTIRVESEEGKGSRFIFTLPVYTDQPVDDSEEILSEQEEIRKMIASSKKENDLFADLPLPDHNSDAAYTNSAELGTIVSMMKGNLMERWKKIKMQPEPGAIRDFALELRSIGSNCNIERLNAYANRLQISADKNNPERISGMLDIYPLLITELEHFIESEENQNGGGFL